MANVERSSPACGASKDALRDAVGTERPRRLRRQRNGRRELVKNPASRRNGIARRVAIFAGGISSRALRHGVLHRGPVVGKAYVARQAALTAHLGGDPTVPQLALVDQAARLWLLSHFAWLEILRSGAFREGEVRTAFDAY